MSIAGSVYVSEYTNMGDLNLETPMEPARRVQRVEIGGLSELLDKDTRMVVLFATTPCKVAFMVDGETVEGAENRAFPVAENVETVRVMRLNTSIRIAVFDQGYW